MAKNAQQTSRGPVPTLAVDARDTGDGRGFSRSTNRHCDSLSERRRPNAARQIAGPDSAYAENTMKPASLFDQLQKGAPAPALWRFWLMRCFRRQELLPRHRIA
jgi:hypothetical protein